MCVGLTRSGSVGRCSSQICPNDDVIWLVKIQETTDSNLVCYSPSNYWHSLDPYPYYNDYVFHPAPNGIDICQMDSGPTAWSTQQVAGCSGHHSTLVFCCCLNPAKAQNRSPSTDVNREMSSWLSSKSVTSYPYIWVRLTHEDPENQGWTRHY